MENYENILGYEPADHTVHPPPKKNVEGVPQKMSSKGSLYFSELFMLKDSEMGFLSIFTQTKILINITLFDNNE